MRLARPALGLVLGALASAPGRAAPATGTLLLRVDVEAALAVDGRRVGALAPGELRRLILERGRRRVTLASRGGEVRWEEQVEVKPTQVVRVVRLARALAQVRQDYVRIAPGRFEMGCVDGDARCEPDERPRHAVTLRRGYWMMRSEVTVAAYQAYARRTGRAMPPEAPFNQGWRWETYPIVNVSWRDAEAYCRAAGGRLPTEAEWERAARAARPGAIYAWGNEPRPILDGWLQANVCDDRPRGAFECQEGPRFERYDDGYSYTAPILQYAATGAGPYDLAGNVWEWCADWYGEASYAAAPPADPRGPPAGTARVLRGGSWSVGQAGLRTSNRAAAAPDATAADVGFRCVRDLAMASPEEP